MAINQKDLILYDDDINTVKHVRYSLIELCDHSFIQAEQCLVIISNKGKCQIKRGDIIDMLEVQRLLQQRNLTVDIMDPVEFSTN